MGAASFNLSRSPFSRFVWSLLALTVLHASPLYAESSAEKTGREMHEEILQQMPIYGDAKVTEYVEAIGQKIIASAGVKKPKFTFTVIDDETINAFALPGGYIYVHRGLITYLNSEAQLAAVIAHEIGHITENHHGRQKRAAVGNVLVAGVLGVLTGSGDVAEASALWGQTLVSGFGRDMELEADQVGAEYLVASGYDPQAMIEVIALLKDQERLERKKARDAGRQARSYHGLFATHPQNDQRLREAVNSAGKLNTRSGDSNVDAFRLATDGLVWGKNYGEIKVPENVYQNDRFAYRFTVPEGWSFSDEKGVVIGEPNGNPGQNDETDKGDAPALTNAKLQLEVKARTTEAPDIYIKNRLNIPFLKKSESIEINRLKGHSGMIPAKDDDPEKRLAVLYYSRYAFVFTGDLADPEIKAKDDIYKQIIASFRPISRRTLVARESQKIEYVKATGRTSFAKLAKALRLGKYGEEELRIINDMYPVGEPEAGQWIKIIR